MKNSLKYIFTTFCLSLFSTNVVSAQSSLTNKLSNLSLETWVLLIVILAELIIILFLAGSILQYLNQGIPSTKQYAEKQGIKIPSFFQRINKTVAIEDEYTIDLNHNYDGVRELDNKTPGWWSFGFYSSILFAIIYLYRVFISGSMPTQIDELKTEYTHAEEMKAQYMATQQNNIDENNVALLDAEGISKGSSTFKVNCVVCHGSAGEGNAVGPNLTDKYWIHKGSIKDIFTTIKYGYPEKGMKSWKDDFSPLQIAELASYVKSLQGTNPPNAKEPQGEIYEEVTEVIEKKDSLK